MNNKDFITELSRQTNQSVGATTKLVNDTLRILEEHFQQDDVVSISSFGNFEVKKKMERISVIPSTQQRVLVPPKLTLTFKPASSLKEKVK